MDRRYLAPSPGPSLGHTVLLCKQTSLEQNEWLNLENEELKTYEFPRNYNSLSVWQQGGLAGALQ